MRKKDFEVMQFWMRAAALNANQKQRKIFLSYIFATIFGSKSNNRLA